MFFGCLQWIAFQEGETKKRDKKSEDEEPLSREKFEEIQEKVLEFIACVITQSHRELEIVWSELSLHVIGLLDNKTSLETTVHLFTRSSPSLRPC